MEFSITDQSRIGWAEAVHDRERRLWRRRAPGILHLTPAGTIFCKLDSAPRLVVIQVDGDGGLEEVMTLPPAGGN